MTMVGVVIEDHGFFTSSPEAMDVYHRRDHTWMFNFIVNGSQRVASTRLVLLLMLLMVRPYQYMVFVTFCDYWYALRHWGLRKNVSHVAKSFEHFTIVTNRHEAWQRGLQNPYQLCLTSSPTMKMFRVLADTLWCMASWCTQELPTTSRVLTDAHWRITRQ